MSDVDFEFFRKFLSDKAGLSIGADRGYLLASRLVPVLKKWKLAEINDLIPPLRLGQNAELVQDVIDAMMTNETLFFRDEKPFKQFRNIVLPEILKKCGTRKSIRIWSAACSTGQEPYSIAMVLQEALPKIEEWNIHILATDISEKALAHARAGKYTQFEVQRGLPIQMAMKNFTQEGTNWQIKGHLQKMVKFEKFNLLGNMDKFGDFDIVFCRNVLIYFSEDHKKMILQSLARRMLPHSYLFLGGSETIIDLSKDLSSVADCPGLYGLLNGEACASSAVRMPIAGQA
ncbi:MAG: protein-glutamate O-methyltransferase CheR [Alphaproteobacteria bacterium]